MFILELELQHHELGYVNNILHSAIFYLNFQKNSGNIIYAIIVIVALDKLSVFWVGGVGGTL